MRTVHRSPHSTRRLLCAPHARRLPSRRLWLLPACLQATPGLPARARRGLRAPASSTPAGSRPSKRPWGHSPRQKCRTATQRRGSAFDAHRMDSRRASLRLVELSESALLRGEARSRPALDAPGRSPGRSRRSHHRYPCGGGLTAPGVWQVFAGASPSAGRST